MADLVDLMSDDEVVDLTDSQPEVPDYFCRLVLHLVHFSFCNCLICAIAYNLINKVLLPCSRVLRSLTAS